MTLSPLLPVPAEPSPPTNTSLRAEDQDPLDRELERFEALVPPVVGKMLAFTQRPGSFVCRLPIALLFLAGGLAGFLPVVGFWMIPLGLMLIIQDIRPLRPPMARVLAWGNGLLERQRARTKGRLQTRPRLCVTERATVTCATRIVRASTPTSRL